MKDEAVILMAYEAAESCNTALEFLDRLMQRYTSEATLDALREANKLRLCTDADSLPAIAKALSEHLVQRTHFLEAFASTMREHRTTFATSTNTAISFHKYWIGWKA